MDRILVLQPFIDDGRRFDYRLLGCQYLLAEQFSASGLEGASAVFTVPGVETGEASLVASLPPSDTELREALLANDARLGLLLFFETGDELRLDRARLVEAKPGHPLGALLGLTYDGDNDHLPAAVHAAWTQCLRRVGLDARGDWTDTFDTGDVSAANNFLTAVGVHSSCDIGFPVDAPEEALRAAVLAIRANMKPAVNLLPQLVDSLGRSGSADADVLRPAVEAAVELVEETPPEWASMLVRFGAGGSVLVH